VYEVRPLLSKIGHFSLQLRGCFEVDAPLQWTQKAAVISDRTKTQCFIPALVQRNKIQKNKPKIYMYNSKAQYSFI
jgi:hypothetical protein